MKNSFYSVYSVRQNSLIFGVKSNHLGNVLNVITDRKLPINNTTTNKVDYYTADVVAYNDYMPFGALMEGRHGYEGKKTRFGFQGQEMDDEIKGEGNSANYEYRMHDIRLGRFFAVDPMSKEYPRTSPYAFSENIVINAVELEGRECMFTYNYATNPRTASDAIHPKSYTVNHLENTKNLNTSAYKTIHARNMYYQWASSQLGVHGGRWFAAAARVTQWNGVGAAEGLNGPFLSDNTEKFLTAGNKYLFNANLFNAKNLMEKGKLDRSFKTADGQETSFKGLSGMSLDMKLVEYEQSKVQEFIVAYKINHKGADMKGMFKEINNAFSAPLADGDISKVMKNHFTDKDGNLTFNFEDYKDRVKLGQELIKIIYAKKTKQDSTTKTNK